MLKCSLLFAGNCKTSSKTYFFNITNDWEKYEVRMNETVKDIKMWFFQNESECLPSSFLNSTGECLITFVITHENTAVSHDDC